MRTSVIVLICLFSMGCTHHQLRYGTVKQADTLSDVFTRQVLDNLAQFSVEPNSIPHFAVPSEGANAVADTATVGGLALDAFRSSAVFGGSRGATESWVLDPVRNPDRLRRMQCAYQKVFGICGDGCVDCCDVESEFFGTGTRELQVLRNGQQVLDRKHTYQLMFAIQHIRHLP